MDPANPDVLRRLATATHNSAQTSAQRRKALGALTTAWRAAPEDLSLGFAVAELAFELRDFPLTVDATSHILKHAPHNPP